MGAAAAGGALGGAPEVAESRRRRSERRRRGSRRERLVAAGGRSGLPKEKIEPCRREQAQRDAASVDPGPACRRRARPLVFIGDIAIRANRRVRWHCARARFDGLAKRLGLHELVREAAA